MKNSFVFPILCISLLLNSVSFAEEVEIPTEVSEPPYEIGDLVMEQGYYIDRGEDLPKINVRFEENKMRVYWIDENGLIVEPEFKRARARLKGSVRGNENQHLDLLPSGSGLGAKGLLITPHLFNINLILIPDEEGAEEVIYRFRYTPSLDMPVDPLADKGGSEG